MHVLSLTYSLISLSFFFKVKSISIENNRLFDFSRSKKDKTNDKRDATEEKKNAETEVPANEVYDPVRNFSLISIFSHIRLFSNLQKAGYKPQPDLDFQMYLDEIRPLIYNVPLSEQISTLAR